MHMARHLTLISVSRVFSVPFFAHYAPVTSAATVIMCPALVPWPLSTLHPSIMVKQETAWHFSSCECDVIGRMAEMFNECEWAATLRIVQPATHSMFGVFDSRPLLARCMG